jgi:hypothetical protein
MGFKPEMFTVLFAIPRTIGWLSRWQEMLIDPERKNCTSAAGLDRARDAGVRTD